MIFLVKKEFASDSEKDCVEVNTAVVKKSLAHKSENIAPQHLSRSTTEGNTKKYLNEAVITFVILFRYSARKCRHFKSK